jgi:hypothetical protein
MAHWTDELGDADAAGGGGGSSAGNLVRPYTITGGRTAPERDDLTMITLVTTVPEDPRAPSARRDRGLQPEHRTILTRCRTATAVVELAADLDLPVSVTKILIGDLLAAGRVRARPPLAVAPTSGGPDTRVLQAVRDGLRRL